MNPGNGAETAVLETEIDSAIQLGQNAHQNTRPEGVSAWRVAIQ